MAPLCDEFRAKWGTWGKNVPGTQTCIGSGKANTQKLVEFLNKNNESKCAAQRCVELDINGYTDWFLPSKDELDLMFINLKKKGLGGFQEYWYWSSSQGSSVSPNDAWYQSFYVGNQNFNSKSNVGRVQPIRAF